MKYYTIEITYREGLFTSMKKVQKEINKLMKNKNICQIDWVEATADEIKDHKAKRK